MNRPVKGTIEQRNHKPVLEDENSDSFIQKIISFIRK